MHTFLKYFFSHPRPGLGPTLIELEIYRMQGTNASPILTPIVYKAGEDATYKDALSIYYSYIHTPVLSSGIAATLA